MIPPPGAGEAPRRERPSHSARGVIIEPDRHYFRNPMASAATVTGQALFVMPGAEPLPWSAPDPDAIADLWEALATPIDGADLAARAAGQSVSLIPLVEALIARTFVIRGTPEEFATWGPEAVRPAGHRPCRHLVLGVTGAAQTVFLPQQVRRLAAEFAERIDAVLTDAAREFLHPRALAVLGCEVWTDPFEQRPGTPVPHIYLAAADLVLVLPATADALFRFAHGAATDLLALVVAATRAPVVVAPSMHPDMWRHPAVRRNVATLRRDGVFVLEPGPGYSLGESAERQVGGPGFGRNNANLVGALEAILHLSRERSPRACPPPPA